jgi:hypothetical protein
LLDVGDDLDRLPQRHRESPVRIPFKIELRHFSAWLGSEPSPDGETKSLEQYIALDVARQAGGASFTVDDLHTVISRQPVLIALDGLDEVAEIDDRKAVVSALQSAVSRLLAVASNQSLQLIVTTRPAAFTNSPGLSPDSWHYVRLGDLPSALALDYAGRWAIAKGLGDRDRAELRELVQSRLSSPHLSELSRNVMQLSILLFLIRTKGASLPDKRTALYDRYVEVFFDREAEKTAWVLEHRMELEGLHRVLGWLLHSEAEQGGTGVIAETELRKFVDRYLAFTRSTARAEDLFQGVVERLVMLVSRQDGLFEFEVQPLREYFCARYLYEEAPYSPPGNEQTGTKPERFRAIARNPFWLNVTRFFAGCHSRGELSGLAGELESLWDDEIAARSGYCSQIAWLLLADYVFAQDARVQERVIDQMLFGIEGGLFFGGDMSPDSLPSLSDIAIRRRILHRCVPILQNYEGESHSDVRLLVSSIGRSEPWAAELWMRSVLQLQPEQFTAALEIGQRLGLVTDLDLDSMKALIESAESEAVRARRLALLLQGGSRLLVDTFDPTREIVAKALLQSENRFIGPTLGEPVLVISSFAGSCSAAWMGSSSEPSSLREAMNTRLILGIEEETFPSAVDEAARDATAPALVAASDALQELADRPLAHWQTSVEPWELATAAISQVAPDSQTSLAVALAGSVVDEPADYLGADQLFDETRSLLDRVRAIRSQATSPTFWRTTLSACPDERWLARCIGMCAAWGNGSLIARLQPVLDNSLAQLDVDMLNVAATTTVEAAMGLIGQSTLRPDRTRWGRTPSSRLAALISTRCEPAGRSWIYRNVEWSDTELPIVKARLMWCLLAAAERRDLSLSEIVDGAAALGAASGFRGWGRRTPRMDQKTASHVTSSSAKFPGWLVAAAGDWYAREFRRQASPVTDAARSQGWCPFTSASDECVPAR